MPSLMAKLQPFLRRVPDWGSSLQRILFVPPKWDENYFRVSVVFSVAMCLTHYLFKFPSLLVLAVIVAVDVFHVLVRSPEQFGRSGVRAWILALLYYFVSQLTPKGAILDIEYYKGMAALLPILFLAFIAEQRGGQSARQLSILQSYMVAALIVWLAGGTISVFRVLAANDVRLGRPLAINAAAVEAVSWIILSTLTPSGGARATSSSDDSSNDATHS